LINRRNSTIVKIGYFVLLNLFRRKQKNLGNDFLLFLNRIKVASKIAYFSGALPFRIFSQKL